jgi:hypothetical protein
VKTYTVSLVVIFLTCLAATMIRTDGPHPLQVVPSVDYARYAGPSWAIEQG